MSTKISDMKPIDQFEPGEMDRLAANAATVKVSFAADAPETDEHRDGREAFWSVIAQMAKTEQAP